MPPAQTRPGQRGGAAVPGTTGIVQCAPWALGLVGKQPLGTTPWGRNPGSSGVGDQTRPPERGRGWGGPRSPGRVCWTGQALGDGRACRACPRCESPQSKPTRSSGTRLEPSSGSVVSAHGSTQDPVCWLGPRECAATTAPAKHAVGPSAHATRAPGPRRPARLPCPAVPWVLGRTKEGGRGPHSPASC